MAIKAGEGMSFGELQRAYKELTPEDKERLDLHRIGREMTLQSRAGIRRPGMSLARQTERAVARQTAQQRGVQLAALADRPEEA